MALKQDYFSHLDQREKRINAYQLALHIERHIECIASREGEKFFLCVSIEKLSDMISSIGVK